MTAFSPTPIRSKIGCLAFLAKALTKLDSAKPPPERLPARRKRRFDAAEQQPEEAACSSLYDDELQEDPPPLPVAVPIRDWVPDPWLRAEVDALVCTPGRADNFTYLEILRKCGKQGALLQGKRIHAHICIAGDQPDAYLGNGLIRMYADCGHAAEAKAVFDSMQERNIYNYNTMLSAFAQTGHLQEAVLLFQQMKLTNVVSWNAMASAYARNGHIDQARQIFERAPERNTISWNGMLAAYAHAGQSTSALELFKLMDLDGTQPNRVSFLHALQACLQVADAMAVHNCLLELTPCSLKDDPVLGTGIVSAYGRCGYPELAWAVFAAMQARDLILWTAMAVAYAQEGLMTLAAELFERMPQRNVVAWTVMISGYAEKGESREALLAFSRMDIEGMSPDKISFIALLDAFEGSGALVQGRQVHAIIEERGLTADVHVCNALLAMYGRCRDVSSCESVFLSMRWRNVVSWSSLLSVYARNGRAARSIDLFREMQLDGQAPNQVTLLNLLSACCDAQLFTDGLDYCVSVPLDYCFNLAAEHVAVAVEMLRRSKTIGLDAVEA